MNGGVRIRFVNLELPFVRWNADVERPFTSSAKMTFDLKGVLFTAN